MFDIGGYDVELEVRRRGVRARVGGVRRGHAAVRLQRDGRRAAL